MKKALALALVLAACGSKHEQKAPAAGSADPWSKTGDRPKPTDHDGQLADLAKNGPSQDKFPQADAVVQDSRDDITLKDDGTVVHHHHSVVKLLDAQRGKEKFADLHIPYDTKRQTLEITVARTFTDDGKVHVASPEEIGDIVPQRIADATAYSDVRERVVSFPAVDKDSVVELDYTRTTKPGPDAALGGEEMLGVWDPIVARTVTLTVPEGKAPHFAVSGLELKPTESSDAAAHTHTYTFAQKDVADRQPEQGAPVEQALLPRLVYGFNPDWNSVIAPVAERFLSKAVPTPLPPAIVDQANKIVAGAKTDAEKAQAIYKFVAHDIRSVDLPLGWAGYEPHSPEEVLAQRYGDDRDKVGLTLALAAAVKLEGRPVFVRTQKVPVIDSVPTLAQFDRMIAKLTVDGKDVWIDPSDENGQYAVAFAGQDNLVLPLERHGAELGMRPPLDPSTSISKTTASFQLSASGDLEAKYSYELSGWYADRASEEMRALKGENLTRFFQQGAANLSAGAVDRKHEAGDTLSVNGPITVAQDVGVQDYTQTQGGYRVFELPPSSLDVANELPPAGTTTRRYPLWIGTPRTQQEDISVAVPAGWKVAYVPPKLTGSAEGIAYDSHCDTSGQNVTCHTEVKVDKLELAPEQYGAFRDAIAKLRAYERRIVLLEKA
ncbi:MAG TPA: DUF3857 and transglutaminase domain-containing protein [Kofleriaceae bacterium]